MQENHCPQIWFEKVKDLTISYGQWFSFSKYAFFIFWIQDRVSKGNPAVKRAKKIQFPPLFFWLRLKIINTNKVI